MRHRNGHATAAGVAVSSATLGLVGWAHPSPGATLLAVGVALAGLAVAAVIAYDAVATARRNRWTVDRTVDRHLRAVDRGLEQPRAPRRLDDA